MSKPEERKEIGILPNELLCKVFSYFLRWTGVNTLQLVNRTWRGYCRGVDFSSMIMVTVSGCNALVTFGENGGVRQKLPAMPWQRHSSADPAGPSTRISIRRNRTSNDHPLWPTCLAISPKRLFLSQYSIRGIIFYKVNERSALRYERIACANSLLDYPEGLVFAHNFLFVSTCAGTIATIHVDTATLISRIEMPFFILWNAISGPFPNTLLVSCHPDHTINPFRESYTEPTTVDSGTILCFTFDAVSGAVDANYRVIAAGLNRPSGLAICCNSSRLLVTTFQPQQQQQQRRETASRHLIAFSLPTESNDFPRDTNGRSLLPFLEILPLAENFPDAATVPPPTQEASAQSRTVPPSRRKPMPWGLSTCRHHSQRVWITDHRNTLTCRDARTGHILIDVSKHPQNKAMLADWTFMRTLIQNPYRAEPNVVLVI